MSTKKCTKCLVEYPIEHFNKKGSGRATRCKNCVAEYFREYYHNNQARREAHKARVNAGRAKSPHKQQAYRYNITEEKVAALLNGNNGLCVICNTEKATCIDHCHETLIVRGALCKSCNTGLGAFKDNIKFLENAIDYLRPVYPLPDKE